MKRLMIYNLVAIVVLSLSAEIATRTISWLSGKGFTLAMHEVDPSDKKIEDIYRWHPFVGFTFKPLIKFLGSAPGSTHSAEIHVDKHGFLAKDNDLEIGKEVNEIRIATIGGSTTASVNLSFEQNWPGYLGDIIQDKHPEYKIRVINGGTPGFDTAQSIGNLALRVMPFKPDIVIIYHGYNDLKAIQNSKGFSPDYSHLHRTPYGFHGQPNPVMKALGNSMLYVRARNMARQINRDKQDILDDRKRLSYIPDEAQKAFAEHVRTLVAIAESGGGLGGAVFFCNAA